MPIEKIKRAKLKRTVARHAPDTRVEAEERFAVDKTK